MFRHAYNLCDNHDLNVTSEFCDEALLSTKSHTPMTDNCVTCTCTVVYTAPLSSSLDPLSGVYEMVRHISLRLIHVHVGPIYVWPYESLASTHFFWLLHTSFLGIHPLPAMRNVLLHYTCA